MPASRTTGLWRRIPISFQRLAGKYRKLATTGLGVAMAGGAAIATATCAEEPVLDFEAFLRKNAVIMTAKPTTMLPIKEVHVNTIRSNDPPEDRHDERITDQAGLFGIFDGHSGVAAAEFARLELFDVIQHSLYRKAQEKATDNGWKIATAQALVDGFLDADQIYFGRAMAQPTRALLQSVLPGACVIVSYIAGRHLFVAGAGDCRAVLGSRDNNKLIATALSTDHQGDNRNEVARIRAAHPNEPDAIKNGRVKGRLQPTRGIGDGRYKFQAVNEAHDQPITSNFKPPYTTAHPEVHYRALSVGDDFLVLGCDGLWDKMSNEEAVALVDKIRWGEAQAGKHAAVNAASELVREVVARGASRAKLTPQQLVSLDARARRRQYDDTTVVVVFFDREALARIAARDDASTAFAGASGAKAQNLKQLLERTAPFRIDLK